MATARTKAARGAGLLDVARPGWEGSIDLTTLRISNARSCVLGQIYGHYNEGRTMLFFLSDDVVGDCLYNGFVALTPWGMAGLTLAWRDEVRIRRNQAPINYEDVEIPDQDLVWINSYDRIAA